MKKILIVFGACGELGKGVTSVLQEKEFDEIYLFDFKFEENSEKKNVRQITISDLALEDNVKKAFSHVKIHQDAKYFLFSTIGGFSGGKKIWDTEHSELMKMLDRNLITNFNIAKSFCSLIKKTLGGVIIFTSAYTAGHPEEKKFAYGVSKSALSYLIKTLALEGKEIKLSSMGIAPFILDTKANRVWMLNADFEEWIKPKEVGKLIYDLFENAAVTSGNILELKLRIS